MAPRLRMGAGTKRLLFWTPRVLGILFAGFLSVFALDVFSEGYGVWTTIGALLLHLIPTYIVIIVLIVAWRREWVGAILFIGLAVLWVGWAWGRFPWVAYVVMSGPLLVAGILFLLNWIYRAELRSGGPKGGNAASGAVS